MYYHVFRLEIEVVAMEGSQLPEDAGGAFVNVFLGGENIQQAIERAEAELLGDKYQPSFVHAAFSLDLDQMDYDTDEEGFPQNQDLYRIMQSEEIWYGPFNCYAQEPNVLQ